MKLVTDFALSPIGLGLIGCAVLALIHRVAVMTIKFLASRPKLAALEPLVEEAEKDLTAAEKAAQADIAAGKMNDAAKDALAAAKDAADSSAIVGALAAEIKVLTNGPAPATEIAPGGAAVNMPVIGGNK